MGEAAVIRRDAWREYSRGSLWLLPMVSVVLALLLGAVLSRVHRSARLAAGVSGHRRRCPGAADRHHRRRW